MDSSLIATFLIFLLLLSSLKLRAENRQKTHLSSNIINGFPTFNRKFFARVRPLHSQTYCGATVIHKHWVVSSALCMKNATGELTNSRKIGLRFLYIVMY